MTKDTKTYLHTPSESLIRNRYALVGAPGTFAEANDEFDRFIASIRADTLNEAADAAFKDKSIQGLQRVLIGNWLRARAASQ